MICFRVKGWPRPQPRARAFAMKTKDGGAVARMHIDGSAEAWKCDVVRCGESHKPAVPLEGPLRVDIDFFLPRPKRLMRKKDPDGPIYCDRVPDLDNLVKAVTDCMTTDGWWKDDRQIVAGEWKKLYCSKQGIPGALVQIHELPPEHTDGWKKWQRGVEA